MPIFELRDPNGEAYEINAPDEQTAIKAFKQSAGNISQADLFNPDMQARAMLRNERSDLYGEGERTWLQGVGDRARGVIAQAPLIGGFMDEARAGVRSGFGLTGDYQKELAYQRELENRQWEQNPTESKISAGIGIGAGLAGGVAGAARVLPMALPKTLMGRAIAGTGVGGGTGYVEGFSRGEGGLEDRHARGTDSAKWGSFFGAGAPVAGRVIGAGWNKLFGKADNVPSIDKIKSMANASFKAAEMNGFVLKPTVYANIAHEIQDAVETAGHYAPNQPKLANVMNELASWQHRPPTLQNIQNLREHLSGVYDPSNPKQNEYMRVAIEKMETLLDNIKPSDLIGGKRQSLDAWRHGRKLWARFRKAETIDHVFSNALNAEGANYSQASRVTSIRQQLRAIAKDDFKHHRYFTPQERQMILRVIRGGEGGVSVENTLRKLGKYSITNPSGPVLAAGTAAPLAYLDPTLMIPGAVAGTMVGAGTVAKPIATQMGVRATNKLGNAIQRGGPRPGNALQQFADDAATMGLLSQSGRAGDYVSQRGLLGPR